MNKTGQENVSCGEQYDASLSMINYAPHIIFLLYMFSLSFIYVSSIFCYLNETNPNSFINDETDPNSSIDDETNLNPYETDESNGPDEPSASLELTSGLIFAG
ncbi:unnamed protein product [Rhizophagus irregularis]|nr:unnamed protein product [Rhizophagus irregularis]